MVPCKLKITITVSSAVLAPTSILFTYFILFVFDDNSFHSPNPQFFRCFRDCFINPKKKSVLSEKKFVKGFMEYFNFLPDEITLDILSRLPAESVLECKLVRKTWKNLIKHPSFSKMHFHHHNHSYDYGKLGFLALTENFYYVEYNENHDDSTNPIGRISRINLTFPIRGAVFVNSCNGLICFARGSSVCVCNPITRELVMLPEIKRYCCDTNDQCNCWMRGFGYVSSTNEYKVVGMCSLETQVQVHIYTLGSGNGWRNLGKINFGFSGNGIFPDEALYWLDDRLEMIETFDLAEEKCFEKLSLPDFHSEWYQCYIGVLGGFLYFAIRDIKDEKRDGSYDMWLLKTKKDNHEVKGTGKHPLLGWSNEFKTEDTVLAVTKSGAVLTYTYFYLNIYDTKISTSKKLVKFKNMFLRVYPHKNTLVSLKELGEENTITMESVEIEEIRSREQLQKDGNLDYIYL